MPRIIEIDGGLVQVVNKTIESSVPLEEWVERIERRSPVLMPVLPTGTKAAFFDPTDRTEQKFQVLIEREPHVMSMQYNARTYALSLPYVRFFFYASTRNPDDNLEWSLSDYRVFFAKEPYTNPDATDMIPALLPNVYPDGRICFGSTAANAAQPLAQRLDQTVNEFFISRFNGDLTIRRPNGAATYAQWVAMTQNDPTAWMDWQDWTAGWHSAFSFNALARAMRSSARFEPMVAADPIPPVPLGATFRRATEWLQALTPSQRQRFTAAAVALQAGLPEPTQNEDEEIDEPA